MRRRQEPPALGLAELREAGISVVDVEDFQDSVDSERRAAVARLVTAAGWTWARSIHRSGR